MELREGIQTRRSVRRFTEQKVSQEVVREIVEVARFAPSWKNTQTPRYYVVEDEALKKAVAEECMMDFASNTNMTIAAPALVVMSYVEKRCGYERDGSFTTSKEDRWEMFDAGIAAQTFCLAAHEKGLGTCIMGIFDEKLVAEKIALPEGQRVAALIVIGYPEGEVAAPPRKATEDILSFL